MGTGAPPKSGRAGLKLRGDLRREALELLELVEDRVEHEEAGAALDELAEPVDALGRLAPDRDLLGQLAPAVEGAEPVGEPSLRPPAVGVDRDIDPLADAELGGVAPGLGEEPPEHPDLLEERRGRSRPGADEALAELDGPPERLRVMRPEPDRRVRPLDGLGLHARVREPPEPTVERHARLGPEPPHEPDALRGALRAALHPPPPRPAERRVGAEV